MVLSSKDFKNFTKWRQRAFISLKSVLNKNPFLVADPGHELSIEHSRDLILIPPPQDAEHAKNGDHSDQLGIPRSPSESGTVV